MLRELIDAGMLLTVVAAGVALVVVFGRDPEADEHTVDDYQRPEPRHTEPEELAALRSRFRAEYQRGRYLTRVLPPVPRDPDPGPVPWRPPYAELVIAQVLRRYGDDPADIAARMLRGIAEEQRAVAA